VTLSMCSSVIAGGLHISHSPHTPKASAPCPQWPALDRKFATEPYADDNVHR
jgi:hypothetical protein